MVIRKAQVGELEASQRDRFERDVMESMRKHWPERSSGHSEEEIRQFIRRGITLAATFGLKSERHAFTFVNFMCLYGGEFPRTSQTAWAREILEHPDLTPDAKVEGLLAHTRAERP